MQARSFTKDRYSLKYAFPKWQDGYEIVYLRLVDAGPDNACWVICNKVDDGAVAFAPIE